MKTVLRAASAATLAMCLAYAQPAFAVGEIVAPTAGAINSGGPGEGSLIDTFDQSGLLTGYTSGVTNFDTYIAGDPQHDLSFTGNEWFSNSGTSSASVTYDMGSVLGIDALALWNEDASGIGSLALYGSDDGVLFALLGNFLPTNNPVNSNYGPDVFTFAPGAFQFFRFDMTGCPQPDTPALFTGCAIGEVAFRTADVGAVPEPGTWAMMLIGFGAIGFGMRRRREKASIAGQLA